MRPILALVTFAVGALFAMPAAAKEPLNRWPSVPDLDQQVTLADAETAPRCTATTPPLTPRSLGPIRPGQSLRDLEKVCRSVRYGWNWNEGSPNPVVLLRLGEAAVMVEFSDATATSTAYRITTAFPVRTTDGFGPGSELTAMMRAWGEPEFGVGECALYVWFATRPGLSFSVDVPESLDCLARGRIESTGDVSLLPRGTRVGPVLLFTPYRH
jgi:hypothetical protein